jgi:hypothetical protein
MKWYQRTWFIIAMLIFFFPVGLYLLWKHSTVSTKTRWVITGALVAIALSGGLQQRSRKDHGSIQTRLVKIEANGAVAGDTLTVLGTATVLDGALIAWEAGSALQDKPDGRPAFARGHAEVRDGAFKFVVNVKGWPKVLKVWVAFQTMLSEPVRQPAEVLALYGEQGELIEGDTVTAGILHRVEKEILVSDEGTNRLRTQ